MSEEKVPKERVYVSHEDFLPAYKKALEEKISLALFAAQIGQAEQSVLQRVSKYNKQIRGYKETYDKMGIEVPVLGYLSQATGKNRGRKTLSPAELIALLGMKTDSPV